MSVVLTSSHQRRTITYVVTWDLVVWFNYRICSKTGISRVFGTMLIWFNYRISSNRDLQGNFIETVQWPFPHLYVPILRFPPPLSQGPVPTSLMYRYARPPFPPPILTSVLTSNSHLRSHLQFPPLFPPTTCSGSLWFWRFGLRYWFYSWFGH